MPYALNLRDSLQQQDTKFDLYVLVADEVPDKGMERSDRGIYWFYKKDLDGFEQADSIRERYFHESKDRYRWSMKSVFMSFLLSRKGQRKVIFVDPDIHFFHDPSFLFDLLDSYSVLLSPHWRSTDPRIPKSDFIRNYDHGIYNAGFVGASKNGMNALKWWSQACLYRCDRDKFKGFWDDQSYLSLLPALFEKVHILKHKGCNVASWNLKTCRRSGINEQVLIDAKYPVVFIHFDPDTLAYSKDGRDPLLFGYATTYLNGLEKHKLSTVG